MSRQNNFPPSRTSEQVRRLASTKLKQYLTLLGGAEGENQPRVQTIVVRL